MRRSSYFCLFLLRKRLIVYENPALDAGFGKAFSDEEKRKLLLI